MTATVRSTDVKVNAFKGHIASLRKPGHPPSIWEKEVSSLEMKLAKRLLVGMWQISPDTSGIHLMRAPNITEGTYIALNQIVAAEQFAQGLRHEFPDSDLPIKRGKK